MDQLLRKALQTVLAAVDIDSIISDGYEPFILPKSHPAHEAAEAEDWEYQEIPTSKIVVEYGSGAKGLVDWFQREVNRAENEGEGNPWEELEKIFMDDPKSLPIIVLEGNNGKYYLNDGHHRLAIAMKHKMKTIPAIVGRNPVK